MQVRLTADEPIGVSAGALVVPFFAESPLEGVSKVVDGALGGAIAEAISAGEVRGKFGEHVLAYAQGQPYRRVFAVSLGKESSFEPYMLARYAGIAVRYLGRRSVEKIAIALPVQARGNEAACAAFVAEGAITGSFETTLYQERPDRRLATSEVAILSGGLDASELERGVARGSAIGEAVNLARRLAITPANDMTPTHMAEEATKVAQSTGLAIDVLDEERARGEGMGSYFRSRRAAFSRRSSSCCATTAIRRAKRCSRSSARELRSIPAASPSSRPSEWKT